MDLAIKEIIKKYGFTTTEVAAKIGKTKQTLFGIIEYGNPTVNTLLAIASAIGADITEFFPKEQKEIELTALIEHNGAYYKASTLSELKNIVSSIETQRKK